MISKAEYEFYETIKDDLEIVFDVGCRGDNPFMGYNCKVHQFDAMDQPRAKGIFNHTAVGHTMGKTIFHPEYGSILKRTLKGSKWAHITHDIITVPMITIDWYCEKNNIGKIDLLKIDTEGYDLNVIEGARKMLPHIKYIQWEHWNDNKTARIMDILKDYNTWILPGKPINYAAKRKNN